MSMTIPVDYEEYQRMYPEEGKEKLNTGFARHPEHRHQASKGSKVGVASPSTARSVGLSKRKKAASVKKRGSKKVKKASGNDPDSEGSSSEPEEGKDTDGFHHVYGWKV